MAKTSRDSETPASGQQVITARAFIHHNFDGVEKVFWPKRADTKKFLPGVYELPGGHIDFGEAIEIGLIRELEEEFSMRVRLGDPFAAFTYANEIKGSHSAEVVYFAQFVDPIKDIRTNPEDHSTYGWFAESEIDGLAAPKKIDDPEIKIMHKAFALLRSDLPDFAD